MLNIMCSIHSEHIFIPFPPNHLRIYGASFRRSRIFHGPSPGKLLWDNVLSWPLDQKATCPVD